VKELRHVYLVDGSGYIFRAYHALPPLTRSDGTPVGAVLGYCNILFKLLQETDADHLAVVFDRAQTSFRNRIYGEYKAHRPDVPDDLVPQFQLVREATDAFNICRIEREDYEADDLIAAYAKKAAEAGATVTIVSSDKDLMQLVDDKIGMLDPIKQRPIGAAEVREKFGVGPEKVVDVQALCGDSVDNVPGVPGIGVKTAAELINTYGDLENLLAHAPEIKQPKRRQSLIDFAEQARLSKRLVLLDVNAPMTVSLDALEVKPPDRDKLRAFLRQNDFKNLLQRVETRLGPAIAGASLAPAKAGAQPPPAASAAPAEAGSPPLPPMAVALPKPEDLAKVERRYALVQEMGDLQGWIDAARAKGVVAIAAETSNALNPAYAELIGLALSVEPGEACYVPLAHRANGAPELDLAAAALKQIPRDQALAALKPLLEDEGVLKVGQDIKADVVVLKDYGIELQPIDDTMLVSFVLAGGLHGHDLDALADLHFGHSTIKYKEVAGSGKSHIGFAAVPLEKARDYAAEDADLTLRLHRLLKPRLLAERRLAFYETIERPLVRVVAEMERAGIRVDRAELNRLSQDFTGRLAELEQEIFKLARHPFNIGSPKQLGEVLFDELGLPGGRKMKTGAYGTDAAVLEQLAATHDLPARVLDWRQLAKLKSTYADALVEEINPKTGRVHTSFLLAGAITGRLASTEPNLQNIPIRTEEGRKIRRAFVAEPGHVLISADYSQIELRLAAHMADVEPLKEAFRAGADIHALTASQVFGVPMAEMTAETRRRAKAINFGILYGMSAFGLASRIQVPQAEAAEFIKAYFARFPGIKNYMERMRHECRDKGYVETLFGRRCHLPGIRDTNAAHRGYAEREAINAPLQGTAADIIKRAMARIPAALAKAGLTAKMLLQVHDELVFEAPESEAAATASVVKDIMEHAPYPVLPLSVPLVVDTGMAKNWDDAH
jgi:DNA polymerase-1